MKKLFLLLVLIQLSIFNCQLNSQSLSVFSLDTGRFPTMKAKFFAFDANGNQITNLSSSSFEVKENSQSRTVLSVTCPNPLPPTPISSVLTIDVSGSMDGNGLLIAKAAANAWIDMLPLGKSECAITSFDDQNYINQDFTTDRTKLQNKIAGLAAIGGTDYDYGFLKPSAGCLLISKTGKHKKVVVFLSDGQPHQTPQTNQIISEANNQSCVVYSVVIGMDCPDYLKSISNYTGGQWFENIRTEEDAKKVYQQILMTVQGGDPCTIEWQSEISCTQFITNAEFRISSLDLTSNSSYQIPNSSIAKLEFNPAYLTFKNPEIGVKIDTTIKVTARNADFNVTNISMSNNTFDINPKNFSLKAGESIILTVSYVPVDIGYSYCKFTFENVTCPALIKYYASGGKPGVQPKTKTLKLTHPNGGEVFVAGKDTVITWEGVLPDEQVIIEYRPDDSSPWKTLTTTATGLSYKFKVPKIASNNYLARVTAKAGYLVNGCGNPDILICNQWWSACNLDVDTYRNGDPIPEVQDPTAWSNLTTGAWCYYNNDPANGAIYGKLYNWYAVNDPRGLAPEGYHIMTEAEWNEFENCLGSPYEAGGKLKETGTTHWKSPNRGATNSSGFTGLPGGGRYGFYNNLTIDGAWWLATEYDAVTAWNRGIYNEDAYIYKHKYSKTFGFSVRVVRD